MSKLIDLTGQRFGRLTVIKRAQNAKDGKTQWLCRCDCGKETIVRAAPLRRGDSKSCGCGMGIKNSGFKPSYLRRTHSNRLYNIWSGMKYRCETPSCPGYPLYGGRGIRICEEWNGPDGFEHFANWSIQNGYDNGLEIDRIDNDGDYAPENCRWVTHEMNAQNRRKHSKMGADGITFRPSRTGVGGKWRASISVNNKHTSLGTFDTYEEALEARKKAEKEYWGWTKTK